MNVRRGLRRLWIGLAGLWLVGGIFALAATMVSLNANGMMLPWPAVIAKLMWVVLPAGVIAGLGAVAEWAIRGFQDA